jgi:hypothetical protein
MQNARHVGGTAHLVSEAVFTKNSDTLAMVLQDEEGKGVV